MLKCKCGCGMDVNPTITKLLKSLKINEVDITSGARCSNYNWTVGGVPSSDHCKGLAVDIRCIDPVRRSEIINAAYFSKTEQGQSILGYISKIEICDKHIHFSVREENKPFGKPELIIWGVSR